MELTNKSLSKLFNKIHPAIVKAAKDIIKRQDIAEDIAMITWETMIELKDRFENEEKIKAFMFIAAKNLAIQWKKGERLRENLIIWNLDTPHTIEIGNDLMRSDLISRCLKLISQKFNSRYFNIFIKTMHGETNTQIAEELKMSGSTVTSARSIMALYLRIKLSETTGAY